MSLGDLEAVLSVSNPRGFVIKAQPHLAGGSAARRAFCGAGLLWRVLDGLVWIGCGSGHGRY